MLYRHSFDKLYGLCVVATLSLKYINKQIAQSSLENGMIILTLFGIALKSEEEMSISNCKMHANEEIQRDFYVYMCIFSDLYNLTYPVAAPVLCFIF